MTFEQVASLLRIYIEDQDSSTYTDAELLTLIQQGYTDAVMELDKVKVFNKEVTEDVNVVTTTKNYTLTAINGCRRITKMVNLDDREEIEIVPKSQFPQEDAFNTAYYDRPNKAIKFFLDPVYDRIYTVHFVEDIETIATDSTDFPQIPPEHHNIIALCAALYTRGSENDQMVQFWMAKVQKAIQTMLETEQETSGNPQYVREVYGDDRSGSVTSWR